jgi:hypothetical protein
MEKLMAFLRLNLCCLRFFLLGMDYVFFRNKEVVDCTLIWDDNKKEIEMVSFIEKLNSNQET